MAIKGDHDMASGHAADHFIPASLHQVRSLLQQRLADTGTQRTMGLLVSVLRGESDRRADRLKLLHEQALGAREAGNDEASAALIGEFDAALAETLARANYKPLSREDLERAMDAEAVFRVLVHVDLDSFRTLRIYARGRSRQSEIVSRWWGLRKNPVEFDVLERVFAFVEPKSTQPPKRRLRRKRKALEPISLKLFRSIPEPDLEMILPGSLVRMRKMDKAMIMVPAGVSIATGVWKLLLIAATLMGLLTATTAVKDGDAPAGPWMLATAMLGLFGVALGAYTKHQKQFLTYANAYAETLYYQTLDSGPGSFLRVLDESFEEEAKEAILAYAFLAAGPRTEGELDDEIEAWLGGRIGKTFDFEVDDALAKLERLGVAERRGDLWHAKPANEAIPVLERAWQAFA